jgi:hypothetical protein
MAYGQKQTFVAIPQPGTSNLPYATTVPKGGLSGKFGGTTVYPPFVPVTVDVEEYYGWAIEAQTIGTRLAIAEALATLIGTGGSVPKGTLSDIANKLDAINENLILIIQNYKTVSSIASKIETNQAAIAISTQTANNIAKASVSDKIKTNEFYKIYNGETPELRSLIEISKEKIKDALNFNAMMKAQGMITKALEDTAEELLNYFKLVAKEFGITKYIQDKIDALKALVPDPALAAKKLQADTVVTVDSYGGLG